MHLVVARIKIYMGGRVFHIFKRALKAPVESICTSSYDIYFIEGHGMGCRGLPHAWPDVVDAGVGSASISMTSSKVASLTPRQNSHSLQGSPSLALGQFTPLARILAQWFSPSLEPENR